MATAKKSTTAKKAIPAKKAPAKKPAASKTAANKTTPSVKHATKSANTKVAAGRQHITGADTRKTPGKKSAQKDDAGKKDSSANACWPGYEPTPGKKQGEKGSCKPKANQTSAEKKGDQKAAAASKLSGQHN